MKHAPWTLAASLFVGCAGAQAPPPPTAGPSAAGALVAEEDPLPPAVRPLLTDRMYVHGEDLRDLNWAVLFLDHATVQEIAERIAKAPRFAPPVSSDATELNTRIPKEFFALQGELAERARTLSTAAESSDLVAVSVAYGRMVETCVRCHDRYLEKPPARAFVDEAPRE